MRSANGRKPPTNRRATPSNPRTAPKRGSPTYTAEQRETMRRGLRILARIIARAHLRRQASRSGAAPEPPCGGRGRRGLGLNGSRPRLPRFCPHQYRPETPPALCPLSYLALSTPDRFTDRRFVHFRTWRCPLPTGLPTGALSTFVLGAVHSRPVYRPAFCPRS